MSEISVTVNGSTTINPTVGNGDTVNVTIASSGERGPTGSTGSAGPANSLSIGTVSQGTAAATITGTAPSQTLNLVLPKGDTGTNIELQASSTHIQWRLVGGSTWTNLIALSAITGPTGNTGASGAAVELQATSTHLQWRYVGGSGWTNVFALSTLTGPQGPAGPAGPAVNLTEETPQPLGTASAGTALTAARADHVHAQGSIAYSGLSGIPSSFAPSAHSHAVSDITGLQTQLDAKQAAGNYAPLVNSLIPSSYLPSYVDDVVDVGGTLPSTGEVGKIYVVSTGTDTNKIFRWSGSTFIEISPSSVTTVAGRTGDIVLSTTDVSGLSAALSSVSVDVIDGGDYVGVVVTPTPSITITAQPSNQAVSVSTANEVASTLPSGTWGPISRVNSQWITSGYQLTQADYLAVSADGSSWTKRYGLPVAGRWSPIQYANSVYATQAGNVLAYSSDATTWSSATHASTQGAVVAAGGKFVRSTTTGIFTSTDAQNWTQTASYSATSSTMLFNYAGSTWFAGDGTSLRVSTDNAATWSSPLGFNQGYGFNNIVPFGSDFYIGRSIALVKYSGGALSNAYPSTVSNSYGGTFATNGSVLVLYSFLGSTRKMFTSTNGTAWAERTLPAATPDEPFYLFYSGGTFALVFGNGTTYFTSTNGIDWTQRTRANTTYASNSYYYSSGGYLAAHNGSSWNYIQIGASNAVASLSVSAYLASGTLTYQWQLSTDAGTSWSDVSGATSQTLSLSGLTTADSGKRYRCVLSATGVASVTSNSATLTVT